VNQGRIKAKKMANLLIIDDHQIYLDGLEFTLSQNLADVTVLKAKDQNEATHILSNSTIDLILLDLNLAESNGLEAWQQLKQEFGALPVAILSASDRVQDIHDAQQRGALGFINKSEDNQQLIRAIQQILDGNLYFPRSLPKDNSIKLTPRQKDVLSLLAEGLPNKLICKKLEMSEATVKSHLRTLFTLFDVNTRTQCVSVANKLDLIN